MKMTKVPTLMVIAFDKLYTRKMNFKTYFILIHMRNEMMYAYTHTHTHAHYFHHYCVFEYKYLQRLHKNAARDYVCDKRITIKVTTDGRMGASEQKKQGKRMPFAEFMHTNLL